ncbi:PorP/SprF family type IX secretion system membrane protein [Spongiimicrobium sp. 2-473A-2-J]|uniref:PorP/SprF family type IX secretion system membrane protein n=1 Tax=Eudoraea algarum TaxID=3417568 RepID=UPI003D368BEE
MELRINMTAFNKILGIGVLLIMTIPAIAQQDAQYTQYMYNTITINPAYAGSRGFMSFNGIYRSQWVGLEGAPKTSSFSLNTPVNGNVGVGLSFSNDEIGPSIENALALDYAYTLQVARNETKLSFGIKAGVQLLDVDFTKLLIYSPLEPQFQTNIDNRLTPLIGLGTMLHHDKWYVGISAPNLLRTEHYENSTLSTASEQLHVFLTGGYVFDLNLDTKFKPAFLVRYVNGAPLGLDISANFLFFNKLTLGAAYRLDAAVSGLAAFQLSDQIMLGYAYDADTTGLSNYNSGSHEVFLRFELFTRVRNRISPRFF